MPGKNQLQAVVQVVAGLALNAFPAVFLAVYARIAPIDTQGLLALSLAVGVYVAQLLNAFIVEGRLATPDADNNISLPGSIAALSAAAGAALVIGPAVAHPAVLLFSSTGLMSGLLISRSIGVVRNDWQREAFGATVLALTGLGALVLAIHHNEHCIRVLAAGAVVAILARYRPRSAERRSVLPPDLRRSGWVTAETAVVGAVQPAITSILLVTMGPAASVAFRVISTVSNALEPIIAYGRLRLLADGRKREFVVVGAIFAAGLIAVLGAAFGGLGRLVFGPAWDDVGATALLLACLWKGLMLLSTMPFAALRRAGETAVVFWVRGASTAIYLAISVGFIVVWHSNDAIFLAFVLAEALTAILYHLVATRKAPEYGVTVGSAAKAGRAALNRRDRRCATGTDDASN